MSDIKEHKLVSIEGGKAGDFKDQNGNYWATAVFEGTGEPVKVVTPNVSKWVPGQLYYGEVTEAESKAGNVYLRFKRHDRPEPKPPEQKASWQPRDDRAIQAQWAIGQSVQIELAIRGNKFDDAEVEAQAERFMSMIERVKGQHERTPANIPTFDDLPPVDTYESIMDEPVDLDSIPF